MAGMTEVVMIPETSERAGTGMADTTVNDLLADALKDQEFAAEYEKQRIRRVLSEALFRLRKGLGLTQTALAQRVGWRQPYVARLEGNPSEAATAMERLEKFANACGASTMLLFVDQNTGAIKQSVSLGAQPSLQAIASQLVGAPSASLGEPLDPYRLEEMKAVVVAAEQTNFAIGAATERLKSQLEAFQGQEAPVVAMAR